MHDCICAVMLCECPDAGLACRCVVDRPLIGSEVRAEITGRYGHLLADPVESPLFRPIPLSRMMRFPGFSLSEERARELRAEGR